MDSTPKSHGNDFPTIPEYLKDIVDVLAEKNHELLTRLRILDDWKYGKSYDEVMKLNPAIVPYDDLPETEKIYARLTAEQTIQNLLSLGFRVETGPPFLKESAVGIPSPITELQTRLESDGNIPDIQAAWEMLLSQKQKIDARLYVLLAECALDRGLPFLAHDILLRGLSFYPKNMRLQQLLGLTLAETGAAQLAHQILSPLGARGNADGETLGLLARTCKDLASLAATPESRIHFLKEAHGHYEKGFQRATAQKRKGWLDDAIYTGINAATILVLLGNDDQARERADQVRQLCIKKLKKQETDYWALATLGEAFIIDKRWDEAAGAYEKAAQSAAHDWRKISSTRKQARRLLASLGQDPGLLDACFHLPSLVVFAGHTVDQPGRDVQCLPQAAVRQIRSEIISRLKLRHAGIGYSSAACGSDILFLEAMHKIGGEINVVLPYPIHRFRNTSVELIPGAYWGERFDRILSKAATVTIAAEFQGMATPVMHEFTNQLLCGLAVLRARILDIDLIPMAVWDGRSSDEPGDISIFVRHWRAIGIEPEIIPVYIKQVEHFRIPRKISQRIAVFLFIRMGGDNVQNFQIMNEWRKEITSCMARQSVSPIIEYHLEDTDVILCESVRQAGNLALALQKEAETVFPRHAGDAAPRFPITQFLHAVPVSIGPDYFLKMDCICHESRFLNMARTVPMRPGLILSSQFFAALAASENITEFQCTYAGHIQNSNCQAEKPVFTLSPA
jgi:tetratricopeptide (TPR) repeat protein